MTTHRFACGEDVILTAAHSSRTHPRFIFTIERLLPFDGSIPRYRVKTTDETFSRVVFENVLRRLPSGEAPSAALTGYSAPHHHSSAWNAAEAMFTRRVS